VTPADRPPRVGQPGAPGQRCGVGAPRSRGGRGITPPDKKALQASMMQEVYRLGVVAGTVGVAYGGGGVLDWFGRILREWTSRASRFGSDMRCLSR